VIYSELAATRQRMNGVSHVEPTGEETFDEEGTSRSAASRR
jgi:hypothetical protein